LNAIVIAVGRIEMATPSIFSDFYSAYESFAKIEIYYLMVKIQNVYSGNCLDTIFCFFEYLSENQIGWGRPSFDSVSFFLFDKGVYAINQERLHSHTVCAIIAFASVRETEIVSRGYRKL